MTEVEAKAQVASLLGVDALAKLERYAELLVAENEIQNLVSRNTVPILWSRHILDGAQLARFARRKDVSWLDVGSGPGLPGVVLAAAGRWQVTLVEPRTRRVEFLQRALTASEIEARIIPSDVADVEGSFHLITARAVASVDRMLEMTRHLRLPGTRYILPAGRKASDDVEAASRRWHAVFHVEQSVTAPDSGIVLVDRVQKS